MTYRWALAAPQPELCRTLAEALQISPLLAQCLLNRGLRDPELLSRFLSPRLKNLADPFLIPNMAAAVDRLLAARARGELVVIFGDYDVDGVTSTALLVETLGAPADSRWSISCRTGWRKVTASATTASSLPATIPRAAAFGGRLRFQRAGSDQPIAARRTRRHRFGSSPVSSPLPPALALVNPQLGQGFQELCSAGLAFKLVHALVKKMRTLGPSAAEALDLRPQLDLVALGTVADIVPLLGENRILSPPAWNSSTPPPPGPDRVENRRRQPPDPRRL